MMREGKPELYFLFILYQKFFDLSNPNFGNMELCGVPPCGQTRRVGRYVAVFSGKSRYGERLLDAQEKLRIGLRCGNSVRGVRPRPAKNPHLLVYHISVNLSIPKIKKIREHLGSRIKAVVFATITAGHFVGGVLVGIVASGTGWVFVRVFFFVFARGGPVGVCDTSPINPAITFSAFHFSHSPICLYILRTSFRRFQNPNRKSAPPQGHRGHAVKRC